MAQAAVLAANPERRFAERVPTSLRGKVFPSAIDCIIADFTKHGARLRFDADPPADASFVIVVWSSGLAFDAEIRWRSGCEIGVRFAGSRDLRRPAPPHMAEAQAMWRKRRPRMRRKALVAAPGIVRSTRRRSLRVGPVQEP